MKWSVQLIFILFSFSAGANHDYTQELRNKVFEYVLLDKIALYERYGVMPGGLTELPTPSCVSTKPSLLPHSLSEAKQTYEAVNTTPKSREVASAYLGLSKRQRPFTLLQALALREHYQFLQSRACGLDQPSCKRYQELISKIETKYQVLKRTEVEKFKRSWIQLLGAEGLGGTSQRTAAYRRGIARWEMDVRDRDGIHELLEDLRKQAKGPSSDRERKLVQKMELAHFELMHPHNLELLGQGLCELSAHELAARFPEVLEAIRPYHLVTR